MKPYQLLVLLYKSLTGAQLKKIFLALAAMSFISFSEIFSIFLLGSFIEVSLNGLSENLIHDLFEYFPFKVHNSETRNLIIFLSLIFIFITIYVSSIVATVYMIKISANIGSELSIDQFKKIILKDFLYHRNSTSSDLVNKIAFETSRVSGLVILPLMNTLSRLIFLIFMVCGLLYLHPVVSSIIMTLFISLYLAIYLILKSKITENGLKIALENKSRVRVLYEALQGIREIILSKSHEKFIDYYAKKTTEYYKNQARIQSLSAAPRYVIELTAVILLTTCVFIFVTRDSDAVISILPDVTIFGLAAFKVLPSLQSIYSALSSIRAHIVAIDSLDLEEASKGIVSGSNIKQIASSEKLSAPSIDFEKVCFSLNGVQILKDLSFSITPRLHIGIQGPSGAGKSTLLDLLCLLYRPCSGRILINELELDAAGTNNYRDHVGYIPQTPFLLNASIKDNILFGLPERQFDEDRMYKALQVAQLKEFVGSLSNGIASNVGENGSRLSGGQRQRIGIARAVYRNPSILVMDEATSALDEHTEINLIKEIHENFKNATVVSVAHRSSALAFCHVIYNLSNSRLIEKK